MKKKHIRMTIFTVLLCSAFILVPNNLTTINAATGLFIENFSTSTYYDVANTNATSWGTGLVESPDKANPELKGIYNNTNDPVDVFVEGDYAYVADYHGDLSILDISDPANPTSVGNYTMGTGAATPTGVYIQGTVCYVATRNWGLQIVDVSNPASPSNISAYDTIDHPEDVFVSGDFCYIADQFGGVQIVYVNNPSNPTNSSAINIGGNANGVYVENSKLYVTDYNSRFLVYDVAAPWAPVHLGNVSLTNNAFDLSVDGNTAYVANGWAGFVTIDVTVPSNPTILDTYWTGDYVKDAKFEEHKVYVTDSVSGVIVFDVTNPSDITLIGSYDTWNWPDGLFVKDQMVYVTDYFGGFLVLDHTGFENRVVAQSTSIVSVTDEAQIVKASMVLENYSTLWSGMAIALYLSADGGGNWQYLNNGEEITFTNPGTDLRFQLVLICYNLVNATWVSELNIDYTTELDGIGKISPIDTFETNDNTTTLTWYSLTGANNYLLQVDSTGSWISPEINVTISGSVSDYTTAPLSDDTYYWRIAGIDSDGDLGKWSTVWQFNIDTIAPDQTALKTPSNNSNLNDATPYLEWWMTTGADYYQLQVDDSNDFSSTTVNMTTSNTDYTLITPLADNTYYWRVRGIDNAGNVGFWSTYYALHIDVTGPNPPVLIQPLNDSYTNDNTPQLQTDITPTAIGWQFQVDIVDTFVSPTINNTQASNSYSIPSDLSEGRYYWRVRAKDSLDNWGPWSAVWTFTVDTIEPIVSGPADFDLDEGDTSHSVSWVLTEINLENYVVFLDDAAVDSGLLTLVGDDLSISTDGLAVGSHNFTCVVSDRAGNIGKNTVIVTVIAVIAEFNQNLIILPILALVGISVVSILKRRK